MADELGQSQSSSDSGDDASARNAGVDAATAARRRRLVTALAIGAPAVLTLRTGAPLAAGSTSCLAGGGGDAAFGAGSMPAARCSTGSDPNNGWVYKVDTDTTYWGAGANGPGTNSTDYCLIYLQADGTHTTSTPWGGTAATGKAAANYYAIRTTCWSSFFRY